jgi:hypothetical protein
VLLMVPDTRAGVTCAGEDLHRKLPPCNSKTATFCFFENDSISLSLSFLSRSKDAAHAGVGGK